MYKWSVVCDICISNVCSFKHNFCAHRVNSVSANVHKVCANMHHIMHIQRKLHSSSVQCIYSRKLLSLGYFRKHPVYSSGFLLSGKAYIHTIYLRKHLVYSSGFLLSGRVSTGIHGLPSGYGSAHMGERLAS